MVRAGTCVAARLGCRRFPRPRGRTKSSPPPAIATRSTARSTRARARGIAVAEAARNLACAGAVPLAVTDNLNFGNPHKPENFWQLRECVEGLAEAAAHSTRRSPAATSASTIESPAGAIDPTPTVGMVGLIESERHITTQSFKDAGDAILLLGELGERTRRLALPEGHPRPQGRPAPAPRFRAGNRRAGCRPGPHPVAVS